MAHGILQSSYHMIHSSRPAVSQSVCEEVEKFDMQMAGKSGIRANHLYFTMDCKNYPLYLSILKPTTVYACLYNEVKKNLSKHQEGNYRLNNFINDLRSVLSIKGTRQFVYQISSQFQRDYILAHLCVYLDIPINVINSYSTIGFRQLKWSELRIVHYLHQPCFDFSKFTLYVTNVMEEANKGMYDNFADPLILKVLPLFLRTVYSHKQNDLLILSHCYVQSMWKNGSKFLHFFTLHNEEHSVELIRLSYMIAQTFSVYQLSSTDYFYLFMSCYFHDISLITYPDINLFNKETKSSSTKDTRRRMIDAFKEIDSYFENEIRENHSTDSAFLLRTAPEFEFLDNSTRDLVAAISQAHGEDAKDVYVTQNDNKKSIESVMTRTHVTHLKSILRLADSLDISQERVSPFYLSKNFPLMPDVSKFHWISHLAVRNCSIVADYKSLIKKGTIHNGSYLSHENLRELITLTVRFNTGLDIVAKEVCKQQCKRINVERKKDSYHITIGKDDCECIANKSCPLLCIWMHHKNPWINEELLHIADMSNKDSVQTFTTEVSADYLLDKGKIIVDKYIPFIERYIENNTKVDLK